MSCHKVAGAENKLLDRFAAFKKYLFCSEIAWNKCKRISCSLSLLVNQAFNMDLPANDPHAVSLTTLSYTFRITTELCCFIAKVNGNQTEKTSYTTY